MPILSMMAARWSPRSAATTSAASRAAWPLPSDSAVPASRRMAERKRSYAAASSSSSHAMSRCLWVWEGW